MGMMLFECIVMLDNIISPNKDIIHRNEEVYWHIYQVVMFQVVQRGFCPILINVPLSPVVISLEFSCPIDFIKVFAQVC